MVDPIRGGVVYTPTGYDNSKKRENDTAFELSEQQSQINSLPSGNVIKTKEKQYENAEDEYNIYKSEFTSEEKETIVENSFYAEIKQKIYDAIDYIKKIVNDIWTGESDNLQVDENIEQGAIDLSQAKDVQYDINDIIKRHDINMLEAYVTDNGNKKIANNSDLLMRYDKSGKIIEIDPSDKNAILHNRERMKHQEY